ncbi:MAG: tetratricopeptide repeat protein [Promethearchaeota archaeon]
MYEEVKVQKSLNLARDKIEDGKFQEALELLKSLQPVDDYNEKLKAIFYTLNSEINIILGNYPKAYEFAEKGFQYAKKIDPCKESVDTFLNMAFIFGILGKREESMKLGEEIFEILQNLTNISESDRNQRLGLLFFYKGYNYNSLGEIMYAIEVLEKSIVLLKKCNLQGNLARSYSLCGGMYQTIGEFSKALNYITLSQKICEEKESIQFIHSRWLNYIAQGVIYLQTGEVQLALESTKKALSLGRKYNNPSLIYETLNNLGGIYQYFGEWDRAIELLKESLTIAENIGGKSEIVGLLDTFFQLYIAMDDIPAAQQIFSKIKSWWDLEKDNKKIDLIYRLNNAVLLRMSKRTRDLGVAQDIFTRIAQEEGVSVEFTQIATLNLCEMLLDEFKDTKNTDALEEFFSILARMQEAAEKQHSYPLWAESFLLEAKLSLITFNMKKARHSLTQAQQIAEKYGLKLLAIKISNEHDNLLKNLEVWNQMEKVNAPISERIEKIDFDDQISTMLKKKKAEIPNASPESPILLLIMAKSGIPLYTKIFNKEWKINEELFSGFLSAFNTFSSEIFSEGLDRANFGKFTILMTGMPPFMSCYVFEGQSFLAHQKFSKFNETVHASEQIWNNLQFSDRTGNVIRDDASDGLGNLVKQIF